MRYSVSRARKMLTINKWALGGHRSKTCISAVGQGIEERIEMCIVMMRSTNSTRISAHVRRVEKVANGGVMTRGRARSSGRMSIERGHKVRTRRTSRGKYGMSLMSSSTSMRSIETPTLQLQPKMRQRVLTIKQTSRSRSLRHSKGSRLRWR